MRQCLLGLIGLSLISCAKTSYQMEDYYDANWDISAFVRNAIVIDNAGNKDTSRNEKNDIISYNIPAVFVGDFASGVVMIDYIDKKPFDNFGPEDELKINGIQGGTNIYVKDSGLDGIVSENDCFIVNGININELIKENEEIRNAPFYAQVSYLNFLSKITDFGLHNLSNKEKPNNVKLYPFVDNKKYDI